MTTEACEHERSVASRGGGERQPAERAVGRHDGGRQQPLHQRQPPRRCRHVQLLQASRALQHPQQREQRRLRGPQQRSVQPCPRLRHPHEQLLLPRLRQLRQQICQPFQVSCQPFHFYFFFFSSSLSPIFHSAEIGHQGTPQVGFFSLFFFFSVEKSIAVVIYFNFQFLFHLVVCAFRVQRPGFCLPPPDLVAALFLP